MYIYTYVYVSIFIYIYIYVYINMYFKTHSLADEKVVDGLVGNRRANESCHTC